MAKNKKAQTGRVITISAEDKKLLNRYFLEIEEAGTDLTRSQICDYIFHCGLYKLVKETK